MATPQAQTVKKSPFPSQLGLLETAKLELRGKFPFQDFFMYRAKKKIAKEGRKGGGKKIARKPYFREKVLELFFFSCIGAIFIQVCSVALGSCRNGRAKSPLARAGRQAGQMPSSLLPIRPSPTFRVHVGIRAPFFQQGSSPPSLLFGPCFYCPFRAGKGDFSEGR